jgi:murein DD-endopeptidase MepM/ murein hydrolase activator NlpD
MSSLVAGIATVLAAATAPAPATPSAATQAHRADVPAADFTFPVDGPARIGTEPAQRFGGVRGHDGQDVFADSGTPVVAARAGTVQRSTYEGAAGNYAVVDGPDGRSYVYMHLRAPARVTEGGTVAAGQRLGAVGRTGDADGCHLHFEIWTAPGWYRGHPTDPYRTLRRAARRAD